MDKNDRGKRIGMRIRQAREERGLSQDALADELDTKQATVARWEGGAFPRRFGLPRIADALGKPVEWFTAEPDADMEAIRRRLAALEAQKTPLSIPQDILDYWHSAGITRQTLCLWILTGKNQYKEFLGNEVSKKLSIALQSLDQNEKHGRKAR